MRQLIMRLCVGFVCLFSTIIYSQAELSTHEQVIEKSIRTTEQKPSRVSRASKRFSHDITILEPKTLPEPDEDNIDEEVEDEDDDYDSSIYNEEDLTEIENVTDNEVYNEIDMQDIQEENDEDEEEDESDADIDIASFLSPDDITIDEEETEDIVEQPFVEAPLNSKAMPTLQTPIVPIAPKQIFDQQPLELPADRYRETISTQAVTLVKQGATFLSKNTIAETCHAFSRTKRFIIGELSLFLLDSFGRYLAATDSYLLWKNIQEVQDTPTNPLFQQIKATGTGGGWITYAWKNETYRAYVMQTTKNNQPYYVCCGFFPFSIEDTIIDLVNQAITVFNAKKTENKPVEDAFSDMNYRLGRFVNGDLYIFAYSTDGTTYAHGDDPSLVGTNQLNIQDSTGRYVHQEMIEHIKRSPEGAWINYIHKGAPKKTYIKRIKDRKGNSYVVGAGYYPTVSRQALVDLVDRGFEHFKTAGKTVASVSFTSRENDDFRYGNLYLFVIDSLGRAVAHGKDPNLVGQDLSKEQDDRDNMYIQTILRSATPQGIWINVPLRNSISSMYIKQVETADGKFVIGGLIYPSTKHETLMLLTKSAVSFLQEHDEPAAFAELTKRDGRFVRGDIEIFVLDKLGYCYAWGDDKDAIWHKMFNLLDDDRRPFIKMMINTALSGTGSVQYRLNRAVKEAYVENTKKGGKTYIIGSTRYISD